MSETLICPHCNTDVDEHPASRCLDAWVATTVMWLDLGGDASDWLTREAAKHYSTDIAVAWEIVDWIRSRQTPVEVMGDEWYDGGWWRMRVYDPTGKRITAEGYTEVEGPEREEPNVCLAICRAALKSMTTK